MALPKAIVSGGRVLFQDARGRFINRAKYELLKRRDPITGRFLTRAAADRRRGVESFLRAQLGAPPSGKSWVAIAGKYPDRFEDFLQGFEQ